MSISRSFLRSHVLASSTDSIHGGGNMSSTHARMKAKEEEYGKVKVKFQRELKLLTFSMAGVILALGASVFIYFASTQLSTPSEINVPNKYIVQDFIKEKDGVIIKATFTGELSNPSYPDIFPMIAVSIFLQETSETHTKYLVITINEDKERVLAEGSSSSPSSDASSQHYSQLTFDSILLGPFLVEFSVDQSKLALIVSRQSTKETVFDTLDFDILVSEFYTTIGTLIPSNNIYGLGERRSSKFQLNDSIKTSSSDCDYGLCSKLLFWNRNPSAVDSTFDDGNQNNNSQLEGYQPVYLVQEASDLYTLISVREATSGLEVDYYPSTSADISEEALVLKNYSESIQFHVFFGESSDPNDVVAAYHETIGDFSLAPFWAFGYSHGMSFTTTRDYSALILQVDASGFPIDAIWSGLEIIDDCQFNLKEKYVKMITDIITSGQLHWVPLIPYALTVASSVCKEYVSEALDNQAVIMSNKTGEALLAEGFGGPAVFLDFNHPKAMQVLSTALLALLEQGNYSGVRLFQNEPSLKSTGEYVTDTSTGKISQDSSDGEFDDIFHGISTIQWNKMLLNTDARHANLLTSPYVYREGFPWLYERDLHSTNGLMQTHTTYKILTEHLSSPLIISGSTAPGSGSFSSHAPSFAVGTWGIMQSAFTTIFDFQLFGIPFTGLPACALGEQLVASAQTAELCARWYQIASLFPLFHSSNPEFPSALNAFSSFKAFPYVFSSALESTKLRYSLIKHYFMEYLLLKGKGMLFRPLVFVFPELKSITNFPVNANSTAVIGQSLFVFSVTVAGDQNSGSTDVSIAIPPGLWVQITDTNLQFKGPFQSKIKVLFASTPLVFLREGHSIFYQHSLPLSRVRTSLLAHDFELKTVLQVTAVEQNGDNLYQSHGRTLAILDYSSLNSIASCEQKGCQMNVKITAVSSDNSTLKLTLMFSMEDGSEYFEPGIIISKITISGVVKYTEQMSKTQGEGRRLESEAPYDLITVTKTLDHQIVLDESTFSYNIEVNF